MLQRRQSLFREVCKVCLTWCEQHPLEKATFSPAPACGARRVPATCSPAPPRSVAVKPLVPQAPDARWSPLLLTGSSFHITVQVFLRGVCLSEASLSAKQEESADWGRGAGGCRGAPGVPGCRGCRGCRALPASRLGEARGTSLAPSGSSYPGSICNGTLVLL